MGAWQLKYAVISLVLTCSTVFGCNHEAFRNITQSPYQRWTAEDCRVIIAGSIASNMYSDSKLLALATPFTPTVISALIREKQLHEHLSDSEYHSEMEDLMYFNAGMYVDWEKGKAFDKHGNYYKKNILQLDSLLILLTLKNKTWPCVTPIVIQSTGASGGGEGHMHMLWGSGVQQLLCYTPDISDLEKRIFLENGNHKILEPRFVYGRRRDTLGDDEKVFVMFPLHADSAHFLENSKELYLLITGFENDIRLKFDTSILN